jgi:hypothetical protein
MVRIFSCLSILALIGGQSLFAKPPELPQVPVNESKATPVEVEQFFQTPTPATGSRTVRPVETLSVPGSSGLPFAGSVALAILMQEYPADLRLAKHILGMAERSLAAGDTEDALRLLESVCSTSPGSTAARIAASRRLEILMDLMNLRTVRPDLTAATIFFGSKK